MTDSNLKESKEWHECMEVISSSISVDANNNSNQNDIYCGCKPKPSDGPCCNTKSCPNHKTLTECTECHPNCANQYLQRAKYVDLDVKDIGGKGYGLFTLQDLKKGQFVAEYVGELISEKELIKRLSNTVEERHLYMMQLKTNTYVDARYKGSKTRHINHSCEPNCTVEVWTVKKHYRVGIFTTKDISATEELTFDYQWQPSSRKPTKCLCNTSKCRGYLEVFKNEEDMKSYLVETEEEEEEKNARSGRWIAKREACILLEKEISNSNTNINTNVNTCNTNTDTQVSGVDSGISSDGGSLQTELADSTDINKNMNTIMNTTTIPMSSGDLRRSICERLVGSRLKMWWEGNMAFFEVNVLSFDAKTGLHLLFYIGDKTEENVNLMSGWNNLHKNLNPNSNSSLTMSTSVSTNSLEGSSSISNSNSNSNRGTPISIENNRHSPALGSNTMAITHTGSVDRNDVDWMFLDETAEEVGIKKKVSVWKLLYVTHNV